METSYGDKHKCAGYDHNSKWATWLSSTQNKYVLVYSWENIKIPKREHKSLFDILAKGHSNQRRFETLQNK